MENQRDELQRITKRILAGDTRKAPKTDFQNILF